MKITKLHLILIVAVIAVAGIYMSQVQHERKQRLKELAEIEARNKTEKAEKEKLELENRLREEKEMKRQAAVQCVAVAGEYRMAAKKSWRDVSKGQETLRQAKKYLAGENFDEALALARRSISELKSAPFKKVYYKILRGDSLWKIARMPKHYGRGSSWPKIWHANKKKIPDFDLIYPRQVLLIPKNNRI